MPKSQGKTGLIVTIVVLGLTLLVVSGIVIWQNLSSTPATEEVETSQDTTDEEKPAEDTPAETPATDEPATTEPTIDPSTVSTIDIEPLEITVSYVKGIPGFEFQVQRSSDGTQYVEFLSPQLTGTKCTNDQGIFATIIRNPTSAESQSITTKTTKVGEDTYGLSLSGETCASDTALLKEYQTSFNDAFSLLKKME